jgi:hypothetical protein
MSENKIYFLHIDILVIPLVYIMLSCQYCQNLICCLISLNSVSYGNRNIIKPFRGHCDRDHMVVGITTTSSISAWRFEFKFRSWRCLLNTTLCDKVCQWLVAGQLFFPDTPISTTNKTDCLDITEILLKNVLNILTLKPLNDVVFIQVSMNQF